MTNEEYLEEQRQQLRLSVEYFSAKKKPARELWASRGFCRTLSLRFKDVDHRSSSTEPPDVLFRDAKFEIKEILDDGRLRHAEYKAALRRAMSAQQPSDLLEEFAPSNITPTQIARRVKQKLRGLSDQYPPAVRAELDLLFYVNLRACFFVGARMPVQRQFAKFGWRSICVYENTASLVLFAAPSAPRFLRLRRGTFRVRHAT